MYANAILGLVAQTSIHAGASASEAAVDLPIQRESHTDWPVVFGSGVKGALRSHFAGHLEQADLVSVFGPDTGAAADHAGALLVSDARIVLLPIRSLTSHVKWVTCPAVLKRLAKDCKRLGIAHAPLPDLTAAKNNHALVHQATGDLYLEEFKFKCVEVVLDSVEQLLSHLTGEDLVDDMKQNLVIVSDDQFRLLCRTGVPVQAHIAIDSNTKTVKTGALWYEESLPAETLMYCCLSCTSGRNAERQSADILLNKLQTPLNAHNFVQIGGNLTTGMGWFEVNWCSAQEVSHG